ncbi:MAG TPA: Ricin and poly(3-hydroxybutyrate) depolymerase fusion [Polyangia bacterium]
MLRLPRPSGSALVVCAAVAAFALQLSCGGSGTSSTGTAGSSGTSGAAGTSGDAGTSGGAGTMGNGGTTGAAGTGTPGAGGTGGIIDTGTAGTMGAAGRGGTTGAAGAAAGTTGAAGRGGTTGTAGAAGGTTGAAGRGGTTGAAGRGGTTGAAGSTAGRGGNAGNGAAGTGGGSAAGTTGTGGTGATPAMPSSGCGKPAGLTAGRASIDVNGEMREYILYLPTNYDMNKPYRLIFGWHPWGGSAMQTQQMQYFGLQSPSAGQAILVAPEGQDYQNNGLGWGNAGGKDVAFAHAMMDRFGAQLCVDQNRIFSTGFSFGAMFSFTLACTADSMQRAIAPMAGNTTTSGGCAAGNRSVAVMSFIGTDDSLLSGHRSAVQTFVTRDGCSTTKTAMTPSWCDGVASQYLPCSCVQYQNCKTGYPVIECEYKAGHQFAPSSGTTLWNFFSQF